MVGVLLRLEIRKNMGRVKNVFVYVNLCVRIYVGSRYSNHNLIRSTDKKQNKRKLKVLDLFFKSIFFVALQL